MKRKIFKILVLSDLKKSTISTLKSTASLAKLLDAEVDFFHVKRPTEIIKQENEFAARRTIVKQHVSTSKKIKELLNTISNEYDVDISSSFSFGNVKSEIKNYIRKSNPDIIVLGKRKSGLLKISDDNITEFILKIFKGSILITSDKKVLEPGSPLSLGLLDDYTIYQSMELEEALMAKTMIPLKTFKIGKNSGNKDLINNEKSVEFVFENNANAVRNLSYYLLKNNINMAFFNRGNTVGRSKSNKISELIRKIDVPILLSNKQAETA
ncbi:MAG: universal stress protein [Flavobacteriaceae bacterium]|nr:universal stress protein [Flavobacteriaceae bacterium]